MTEDVKNPAQEEESLVRRAQQGEEQAFARLYEVYFDRIYRYLYLRMGNQMEAEDLTQQVFLKALESISGFKWKGAPFSSWLYRIAHNLAVDTMRKKSRSNVDCVEELEAVSDCNLQVELERKLDIQELVQATRKLTKAQCDVISLRFAADLPIAQVAKIMGKSEGAIKALQHSAILSLRKVLVVEHESTI